MKQENLTRIMVVLIIALAAMQGQLAAALILPVPILYTFLIKD